MKGDTTMNPSHPDTHMSEEIEACPHCGGTSGLYVTYQQSYEQHFRWDGENLGPTEEDGPMPKIAKCSDCRKQVTKLARQIKPWNDYRFGMGKVFDMGNAIMEKFER